MFISLLKVYLDIPLQNTPVYKCPTDMVIPIKLFFLLVNGELKDIAKPIMKSTISCGV